MFFTFKPKNGNELLGTSQEKKNFSFLYLTTELSLSVHGKTNSFYHLMIGKKIDYFKGLINKKNMVLSLLQSQRVTFEIIYKDNIECLRQLKSIQNAPLSTEEWIRYRKLNKKLYKDIILSLKHDYNKIRNFLKCIERYNYKGCFEDLSSLKLFNQYLNVQRDTTMSIKYLNAQLGKYISIAKFNRVYPPIAKKAH